MFCTNCGERMDGEPLYCTNCGAALRGATSAALESQPVALPLKGHPLRSLRASAARRQNPEAQPAGTHFLNSDPSLPYPFWNEECDLAGVPRIRKSLWKHLAMLDGVPTERPGGYCPCCGGAVSEEDRRRGGVCLPGFTARDWIYALVEYYECPCCHQMPSEEDLLASPKGADPAFECSIRRMQRIAAERMTQLEREEHEPASPGFCVMCGSKLEPGLRLCPSCGALIKQ